LTSLQLLSFYNAIANNGRMMRPYIVSEIRDAYGVREKFEPKVLKEQIASDATLAQVREMLEGVVQNGTARRIRRAHYKIAGKTGTAKVVIDGEYRNTYRGSFVGYFPADNPRYSCIVLIGQPKSGQYYGADVAAPVFKDIADNVYSTLLEEQYREPEIHKPNPRRDIPITRVVSLEDAVKVYNQLNVSTPERPATPFVRAQIKGETVKLTPYPIRQGRIPALRGMSARDAIALLENMGLAVQLDGSGKVYNQSLQPGAKYIKGQTIKLRLQQ